MSISVPSHQFQTPLLDALQSWANRDYAAFHTPGHKRGQGASDRLRSLLGSSALAADLPELPALDNLFAPAGVIQQAQALAAEAFGADRTWFLVNGSTAGIIAAILAICQPGDRIVLPRNVHQSVISGLILAGVNPIFVMPAYDVVLDIAHGVSVETIAQALAENSDIKAVLIVSPTYYGVCCDVEKIAQVTHQYNIPLIVDEAHGAHFGFHPDLPMPALLAGADMVVQSTHKTLSALTQSAMLHLRGDRVNPERIRRSIQLIQSTSPNYLLLASLDVARQQMATIGKELLSQTLLQVATVLEKLSKISKISVLDLGRSSQFDRTRLIITVSGLGITGFTADEILTEQYGVICELPSLHHLTFILSIGTTDGDCDRLVDSIHQLVEQSHKLEVIPPTLPAIPSETVISPREAFFAKTKTVKIEASPDQISAELICPYPPGIPVLLPGERITKEAIEQLQRVLRSGGFISGCADPELQTIQILE